MVRPAGVEPTTYSFGNCHSIQMSYGRLRARSITVFCFGRLCGITSRAEKCYRVRYDLH